MSSQKASSQVLEEGPGNKAGQSSAMPLPLRSLSRSSVCGHDTAGGVRGEGTEPLGFPGILTLLSWGLCGRQRQDGV